MWHRDRVHTEGGGAAVQRPEFTWKGAAVQCTGKGGFGAATRVHTEGEGGAVLAPVSTFWCLSTFANPFWCLSTFANPLPGQPIARTTINTLWIPSLATERICNTPLYRRLCCLDAHKPLKWRTGEYKIPQYNGRRRCLQILCCQMESLGMEWQM